MSGTPASSQRFATFREFYPFYLSEHRDRNCRRMHFAGSSFALAFIVAAIVTRNPWWLLAALICGYGFAWIATLFREKTSRRSFQAAIYSSSATCDVRERLAGKSRL